MPDIVLVYPKLARVEEAILLPISILTVAGPCVQAGLDVCVVDQRTMPDWRSRLARAVSTGPAYVGISCMTGAQIHYGLQAAELVSRLDPAVPKVWGGVHPTLFPRETLEHPLVDLVCAGEGDRAGRDLALALRGGEDPTTVPGIFGLRDGVLAGQGTEGYLDLDELPDLPYELVDVEQYVSEGLVGGRGGREICFFTSRGCPFRCGFCYVPAVHNRRWRDLHPDLVLERMKRAIRDFGVTAFALQDDYFFASPRRAREICERMVRENLGVRWFATCRIDLVGKHLDRDFLRLIKASGCRAMAFGVESGNDRVLDYILKDFSVADVLRVNRYLRDAEMDAKYYFVAGFPTETESELYDTLQLMQTLRRDHPRVRIPPWRVYTPYPGACLFEHSRENGFVPPHTLEDWGSYEFSQVHMPWVTPRLRRIIEMQPRVIRYLEVRRRRPGLAARVGDLYSGVVNFRFQHRLLDFVPELPLVERATRGRRYLSRVLEDRAGARC